MAKRKKWLELTKEEQDKRIKKELFWGNFTAVLFGLFLIAEAFIFIIAIKPYFFPNITTVNEWLDVCVAFWGILIFTFAGGMFLNFLVDNYLL